MVARAVVIIGLPGSGKTTFLAALWHLVSEREIPTRLGFKSLIVGDASHLNDIASRWRDARVQERTAVAGIRVVSMSLKDEAGEPVAVTFPDVPGESYRRMWEERDCEDQVAEILKQGNVLFFVHADAIQSPQWVVDEVALSKKLGIDMPEGEEVTWHPRLAPTQVQVVDLLQLLRSPPLNVGPRKIAMMLSAWDKAEEEGQSPEQYLTAKLPLVAQYLKQNADDWTWRVYGVSAQGGDYDPADMKEGSGTAGADKLRRLDQPSTRIRLVGAGVDTHDLTEPLEWLMD